MVNQFNSEQIKEFWLNHERFLKNNLVTETPNPQTYNLSKLCQNNLDEAFILFKQIELNAINQLNKYIPNIKQLQEDIAKTIKNNHKVFLVGCGASGRLCMLLKRLWEFYNPNLNRQVICVSSAGDISLIKAVEQFEDKAEFGVNQLLQQGFCNNDLVIGLSASGESPFILAAIEYASKHSIYKPYLVFNNQISTLLERNPYHLVANSLVKTLELNVGPMALTGSTRLQATTAMQIAVGIALCKPDPDIKKEIDQILQIINDIPLEKLAIITSLETDFLNKKEFILYETNDHLLGLSILADTTERSPTFNLPPYENTNESNNQYSLFYLSMTKTTSSSDAWEFLLGTSPVCLGWLAFPSTANFYIQGFDLSNNSMRSQGKYLPNTQHTVRFIKKDSSLLISLSNEELNLKTPLDPLHATLVYKLCLNSHSTLMMGRLGYFWGNMMLSLKPSNFKLIDRAIRYSQFILKHEYNKDIRYSELADIVFAEINKLEPNQSIVKNVVNYILKPSQIK